MTIAFLNGQFIPAGTLSVPPYDAGFVLGVTVAEQLRTFGGELFRMDEHLSRFNRSLEIIGLELPYDQDELTNAAASLIAKNRSALNDADDLGLCLFATPGAYPTMAPTRITEPTVGMHTYPIPFALFNETYQQGQRLAVSSVPQISAATLPRELKCRSRVHYYLADREAAQREPGAKALMLDDDGSVLESTTANILIYRKGEGLVSPPTDRILPGISVATTFDIASRLSVPHTNRPISVTDVQRADEAFLTSTSVCILPVVALDGVPIGTGTPGEVFQKLLAGWSELVGVDVARQANRFAQR